MTRETFYAIRLGKYLISGHHHLGPVLFYKKADAEEYRRVLLGKRGKVIRVVLKTEDGK